MTKRTLRAFTFAEVLAAMVFMAIVIPAAVEGVLLAHRAAVTAARERVAARLADNLLAEMVATGDWRDGDLDGDFGEDWPGYSYEVRADGWDEDTMRLLEVEVFYYVQTRERSVVLGTVVPEEEETAE